MNTRAQLGFTLTEILIVLFIFGTLVSLPMIFLWGIGRADALLSSTREVIGVIHEAQVNTVSGRSVDGAQTSSYGIYFATNYYVLFSGTTYNASDSNNARIDLPAGITLSQIQLPNSVVVFDKVTGKVINFDASQNYVVLLDSNTAETKKITVTSLGSVNYE